MDEQEEEVEDQERRARIMRLWRKKRGNTFKADELKKTEEKKMNKK